MLPSAPASIMPSRPMLTTPLRSEMISPTYALASGMAKRTEAARKSIEKNSWLRAIHTSSRPPLTKPANQGGGLSGDHEEQDQALQGKGDPHRDAQRALGAVHSVLQAAEEQSGKEDPDRRSLADQGHGDGGETIAGGEEVTQPVLHAQDHAGAGQPRQAAAQNHRQHRAAADPDSGEAGRLRPCSDGAQL